MNIYFSVTSPTPPKTAHNGNFPLAKSAQKRDFLDFSIFSAKGQIRIHSIIFINQNIFKT